LKVLHRLEGPDQSGAGHQVKMQVFVLLVKKSALSSSSIVEVGIYTTALHDVPFVEVSFPVPEEINAPHGLSVGQALCGDTREVVDHPVEGIALNGVITCLANHVYQFNCGHGRMLVLRSGH
jgi:hypothetical protein